MRASLIGAMLAGMLLIPDGAALAQDETSGDIEIITGSTEIIDGTSEIIDGTSSSLLDDEGEKPPFTVSSWKQMTQRGQEAYIRVTIEGLRWSPRYVTCGQLTPNNLLEAVRFDVTGGEASGPLLMHVASAAQRLCA